MATSSFAGQLRAVASAFGVVTLGCHAGTGVAFDGRSRTPLVAAEHVLETQAFPSGVTRLGSVHGRCRTPERWTAFQERALADVDCSEARLRRMLREAAAANGGDLLVGLECESNGSIRCSAGVGRGALRASASALAVGPPAVGWRPTPAGDVRGSRGADVSVDFSPLIADPARPARSEAVVGDIPLLPPSHVVAATLGTACERCSELEARDALRIAAARAGASDVVGVRCFQWGPGYRCAGAAAMTRVAH